jgi:DNA-binding winged helix-turn-helix (wHTH) protein/tetratricopeptide (TPR) repeat protein
MNTAKEWQLAGIRGDAHRPTCFGEFTLDREREQLTRGGTVVPLRPKTFALLAYLVNRPGKLLSKDELLQAVWPHAVVTPDSLTQCISELRSALDDGQQRLIRTVSRRGYRFEAAETAAAPKHAPLDIDSALSARRSIAVLPFVDLSEEKRSYFVEGVAEDLTAALARVPHTLVMARGSAAAAAAIDADPRKVGAALAVRYVLTGSLRRSDTALTIIATFVSAQDGMTLWTERFDYPSFSDWSWQQDIAQRIAGELHTRLSTIEGGALSRSVSADAVDQVMRARAIENRSNHPRNALIARSHYEAALKVDPDSVSALAGLGHSYADQLYARWSADRAADIAQAELHIAQALELDPNYGPAHLARGHLRYVQGDNEGALMSYRQVVALNPSDASAYAHIAMMMFTLGRPAEIEAYAELAIRLDPLSVRTVSLAHNFAGLGEFALEHDDAAYARLRQAVGTDPTAHSPYLWMAALDGLHGRLDAARDNLAAFQRLRPLIRTYADVVATGTPQATARDLPYRARALRRRKAGLLKAGLPEGKSGATAA